MPEQHRTTAAPPATAGTPPDEPRPVSRLLPVLAPAVVLVAVVLLDQLTGDHAVALTLVVAAPLHASTVLGPVATGVYAGLALAAGTALGFSAGEFEGARPGDQAVRLATISIGGLLAVVAARRRCRREARLARVLQVAAVAQRAILPTLPERLGPVRLAACYDSAARDALVGGDLYAAERAPCGAVRLLVGDVRGKGLDAVRLASVVLGAFRERAHERDDVGELVRDLDRSVSRAAQEEDFVTAVVVEFDGAEARVVNAGHVLPLLVRGDTAVPVAGSDACLPLGLGPDCEPVSVALRAGDRLLLCTDGVTEARRPSDGAFFPLDRLAAGHLADVDPAEGLERLRGALIDWAGGELDDDVTLLVAQYDPAQDEPVQDEPVQDESRRGEPRQGETADGR